MLNKLADFWSKLKPQYDDDIIDRLNYLYTNIIILAFAITIGAKQYVGEPLQCWVPAQFKGGWEQYVENYCFVENTYWVPMHQRIPDDVSERDQRELQYYQWVPFVLALQALMFYIPRAVWKMLNAGSGLNVTALIQSAFLTEKKDNIKQLKDKKAGDDAVKLVIDHIGKTIKYQRDSATSHSPIGRRLSKGLGIYVNVVYLFVKLLFIVNVIGQFLILNKFLGPQYDWWGFGILRDLAQGREWEQSGHFPRVTLCDFEVRRLGNLHRWTVQCVLMINMFNEKIYLVLWWWFFLVAVLTCLNFVYWLVISIVPYFGYDFVRKYLKYQGNITKQTSPETVEKFVDETLRKDGVLVLRLISDNAGDIVCSQIVNKMWEAKEKAKETHAEPPLSDDEKSPLKKLKALNWRLRNR